MARRSSLRGLSDIHTVGSRSNRARSRHEIYMQITALEMRRGRYEAEIAALEGRLAGLRGRVDDLKARLRELHDQVVEPGISSPATQPGDPGTPAALQRLGRSRPTPAGPQGEQEPVEAGPTFNLEY